MDKVEKKRLYIDKEVFDRAVEEVKKANGSLYETFYSTKGGDSKLFNYFVRKLIKECLDGDEKEKIDGI